MCVSVTSAERWPETKPTCFVQGHTRTGQKGKRLPESSEQEMKARSMIMTWEQINSHPSGRVILLPFKRVEADEVRLQECFVCFIEQWGNSSEGVFSSVPSCNQHFCIGVLRVFMEAVGRRCPTSGLHSTGFCIMTTRHGTQIYGFFWRLTKK